MRRIVIVMALALGLLGAAGVASAALNTWYPVPGYYGSGYAAMTSFYPGSARGQIYLHNSSRACIYAQAKPVARAAVDGGWKRQTSNNCGGGYYYNWRDSFYLTYQGFKFRICRDVFGPDPCGRESAAIYP